MSRRESIPVSVTNARRRFSVLLEEVARERATFLITRLGRPMARLVPSTTPPARRLSDLKGWLDDDDPFFEIVDRIIEERSERPAKCDEYQPLEERTWRSFPTKAR
jgi:prevent-host-death family protein